MSALIDLGLTGSRANAFMAAFLPFARQVAQCGVHNSLIQTAIKLTAPGVPDLYTGSELWDLSMVDPDNRRPVDYTLRVELLQQMEAALSSDRSALLPQLLQQWCDGRIKLAVIACLLRHRSEQPDLYTHGDYQPLPATGPRAEEIGAYARTHGEQRLIVAFARYARRRETSGFDDSTLVPVPESFGGGPWHEILSGRELSVGGNGLEPRVLFSQLPVAVLASA
jgi:(1->4)-alpha-D-glucan 1-alpha-D-glucosylmutase